MKFNIDQIKELSDLLKLTNEDVLALKPGDVQAIIKKFGDEGVKRIMPASRKKYMSPQPEPVIRSGSSTSPGFREKEETKEAAKASEEPKKKESKTVKSKK